MAQDPYVPNESRRRQADAPPSAQARQESVSDITQSPEFQAAVAKAVQAALGKITSGQGSSPVDFAEMFSQMSLSMAEMAHQGSGRPKPVSPEVIMKREAAEKKYRELLAEANEKYRDAKHRRDEAEAEKWLPEYRLVTEVYLNETYFQPYKRLQDKTVVPVDIFWNGPLSEAFHPLNDIARRIWVFYRESIGSSPKLGATTGPDGQVTAVDTRNILITSSGTVMRVNGHENMAVPQDGRGPAPGNDHPEAPFVHVLGTVSAPAKRGDSHMTADR